MQLLAQKNTKECNPANDIPRQEKNADSGENQTEQEKSAQRHECIGEKARLPYDCGIVFGIAHNGLNMIQGNPQKKHRQLRKEVEMRCEWEVNMGVRQFAKDWDEDAIKKDKRNAAEQEQRYGLLQRVKQSEKDRRKKIEHHQDAKVPFDTHYAVDIVREETMNEE